MTMTPRNQLIVVALISSALTAAALLMTAPATPLAQPSPPPIPDVISKQRSDIDDSQQTIASLEQQLRAERDARGALEYELQLLEDLLAGTTLSAISTSNKPATINHQQNEMWFDEQRLSTLNIDPSAIETIKEQFNKAELDKLTLRNNALRDKKNRSKLYKQLKDIEVNLRANLGEQDYDRMLYAAGRNNRVEVTDTLAGSAAAQTGIQKGDLILSYGGESIYDPSSLYINTSKGEMGEMIAIELQRDGEVITAYVPRGPLGTRFKPVKSAPQ